MYILGAENIDIGIWGLRMKILRTENLIRGLKCRYWELIMCIQGTENVDGGECGLMM